MREKELAFLLGLSVGGCWLEAGWKIRIGGVASRSLNEVPWGDYLWVGHRD